MTKKKALSLLQKTSKQGNKLTSLSPFGEVEQWSKDARVNVPAIFGPESPEATESIKLLDLLDREQTPVGRMMRKLAVLNVLKELQGKVEGWE